MTDGRFKKGHIPWHKGKSCIQFQGKNNGSWKAVSVPRPCGWCKKDFTPRATRIKTCSRSCGMKLRLSVKGNHPRLGKKVSPQGRLKMREAKLRNPVRYWLKGEGVTPLHEKLRRTDEYKQWRKSVFERDNYTCQECGIKSSIGINVFLHADHIKPFAFFPELRTTLSNGRTLCKQCHLKTNTWGRRAVEIYG